MTRAETYEEIQPLVEFCKAGRLFDAQDWIRAGKPINPPYQEKGNRKKSPLEISIALGFHSLVQVLLDGGVEISDPRYNAIEQSLSKKRLDLIKLILQYGADIHSVNMNSVFDTRDPDIIRYFIESGADVETGYPLAWALINRIWPALGIYKTYKGLFSSFYEQLNIALRFHCKDGNLKWISLMLWAGADPFARGPASPKEKPDPDGQDLNALEYAALYKNFDIFNLKKIHLDPDLKEIQQLMRSVCVWGNSEFLKELMSKGLDPGDQGDDDASLIHALIDRMSGARGSNTFYLDRHEVGIDNHQARDKIKMIHMLARAGARWTPSDKAEIASARRSFLKLTPDYILEFIWIMSGYQACKKEDIEELIRKASLKAHISEHTKRVNELMEEFNSI